MVKFLYPKIVAQIRFFLVLGKPFLFLGSRVVPRHEFGACWKLFLLFFGRLLDFLEGPILLAVGSLALGYEPGEVFSYVPNG